MSRQTYRLTLLDKVVSDLSRSAARIVVPAEESVKERIDYAVREQREARAWESESETDLCVCSIFSETTLCCSTATSVFRLTRLQESEQSGQRPDYNSASKGEEREE